MLALALALLFTLIGVVAVLVIADSAIKAVRAYDRLMQEAALMQAGFVLQVEAQELRVRRGTRQIMRDRRVSPLRVLPAPACAAA